ncbi:MAG: CNNM domain-containing protein, partial [Oscillospiraceae bacterium]
MNDPIIWQILLQVLLIALNAVFACAEIAVISMNDNKLAQMAAQGDKRAVRLARLTSQPARFLATIQVAITLSGFMGSAFAADNFSDKLVQWLLSLGVTVPVATLDTAAVIVITLILSYFTLVFGELVPKRIAMKKAEALALGMSGLITAISKLFAPLVWLLTASTNGMLRLFGIDPNAEDEEVSEEEIRMMVDVGNQKGVIDPVEREMIQNVFEFDALTVGEFATHRTELALLWMDETAEE